MMESTPSRDNRDIIIDATLFSVNLAQVRNRNAKVFSFVFFITVSVFCLKTTFWKMITKNYTPNSLVNTHVIICIGNETCKVSRNGYFIAKYDEISQVKL